MAKNILRVEITGLQVKGKLLVGDLWYDPYNIYVDEYVFRDGDTVVVSDEDDNSGYIDMEEDYLFDIAYGV